MPIVLNPSADTILTFIEEKEEVSGSSFGIIEGSGEIVGVSFGEIDVIVEGELVDSKVNTFVELVGSKVNTVVELVGASVISEGKLVGTMVGAMVYNDADIPDDDSSSNGITIPAGLTVGASDG